MLLGKELQGIWWSSHRAWLNNWSEVVFRVLYIFVWTGAKTKKTVRKENTF